MYLSYTAGVCMAVEELTYSVGCADGKYTTGVVTYTSSDRIAWCSARHHLNQANTHEPKLLFQFTIPHPTIPCPPRTGLVRFTFDADGVPNCRGQLGSFDFPNTCDVGTDDDGDDQVRLTVVFCNECFVLCAFWCALVADALLGFFWGHFGNEL